jgi:hypothetical protein
VFQIPYLATALFSGSTSRAFTNSISPVKRYLTAFLDNTTKGGPMRRLTDVIAWYRRNGYLPSPEELGDG